MVQGVPVHYAYDDTGRISKITIGTGADARAWTYVYAAGTITVTDPMGDMHRETCERQRDGHCGGRPGGHRLRHHR